MKMILFDIDGTLLRTGGIGADAVERAFNELFNVSDVWGNYDPSGKTDYQIIQELSELALRRSLSDAEQKEVANRYICYFQETIHLATNFRILPGVHELLSELCGRNYLIGLATGNLKETADIKLKHGKIDHFFTFGGFGCDAVERLTLTRRALERGLKLSGGKIKAEEVVLIGDARQDMECGRALGLRTIGVATGSLSVNEISVFNPHLVLENLSDSRKILDFIEN